ncbi:MAG: hypothetical protein Q7R62_01775, partial [bacterium]|nr:hypothetical protein [bacterium]
ILIGLLAVIYVAGGLWYFTKEAINIPASTLNVETAKPGDRFGVWTIRENTVQPQEREIDGKIYKGMGGLISFDGTLEISGTYYFNDLDGGIILLPDSQYFASLPKLIDEADVPPDATVNRDIAFYEDFNDKKPGDDGKITLVMTDLVYAINFCPIACDGHAPFSARVKSVINDVPELK